VVAQTAAPPPLVEAPVETITTQANKIPLEKAVAGFVKSYAAPTVTTSKIAKWAAGICPVTMGLTDALNRGVSALLKQVAAKVGAPVAAKADCAPNVTVIFTFTPQALLDDIAKNHETMLGYHDVAQTSRVATMSHPVQAWYATATRDYKGLLRSDNAEHDPRCESDLEDVKNLPPGSPDWLVATGRANRECGGAYTAGSRLNDGLRSEFAAATIIVDAGKLDGLGIFPIANYAAMLALAQTQTFDACQPLPSVVNMLTQDCAAALKPDALSEADMAYLTALYKTDSTSLAGIQQSRIAHDMAATLGKR
jgi:hypothetical protein